MDDRQIITLYNNRDERAITESANKYGKHCYSIAYNILSDAEDSEECLNDTWLDAWNSIPPAFPSSLKLFLSKIVRNLSLDKYKYRHREKRGGSEIELALEEIEEFVKDTSSVEDEVTERELANVISDFLHTIPERDCNIFLRRYYYVDPISAIAKRYKVSESNVFMILSRTRSKLKAHLEDRGYTV